MVGARAFRLLTLLKGLFVVAAILWGMPAAAQQAAQTAALEAEKSDPAPEVPEFSDILPAATELSAKRASLLRELGELFQPATVEDQLPDLTDKVDQLAARLEAIKASSGFGYDQIADFRAGLEFRVTALTRFSSMVRTALDRLEQAQSTWEGERKRWKTWAAVLPTEVRSEAVEAAFREAHRTVGLALEDISGALRPLLEFQGRVAELQARVQSLDGEIGALMRGLREQLFRKSAPSLFSPAYFKQLGEGSLAELAANLRTLQPPGAALLERYAWAILAYLVFALGLGVALLRQRAVLLESPRWRFVGAYPFATGFLAATLLLFLWGGRIPPGGRVMLALLGAVATARILRGIFEDLWRRRTVYLLIALALLTTLLRMLGLPAPLFRLYMLALVVGGLPLCAWRARVNAREGLPRWRVWIFKVWFYMLALIGVANIGGYSGLAGHALVASLSTTMAGLFVWVLALVGHGAVHYGLSDRSPLGQLGLVRRNARVIRNRAEMVITILTVLLGLAIVLQVWRAYGSVRSAFAGLFSFGITIGSFHLTVGLLLGAVVALYGSLLVSWTVQDILMYEVFPRRNVQWGVRFSMNRLLHYAVILVGFILALGILGLDLQNITILAGALGVGIGFGLQAIVNNFVSGLILLFERPVKVGDMVQLGDQWGTISSIGLRATVVETFDKSEIIVPNSDLVSGQVTNWTLGSRSSRVIVAVGIAYGSDVPLAMKILREVADANPLVLETPEPQVLFMAFGASSLDFQLRVWVEDVDKRFVLMSELHQEIDRRFRDARVEIAFPQRDLHLRTVDERARRALAAVLPTAPEVKAE